MTFSTKALAGGNLKVTVQSSREKKDSRQQAIIQLLGKLDGKTLGNSMLEDAACPTALAQYLSSLSEFLELDQRKRGRAKLERRSELRLGADAVHRRVGKGRRSAIGRKHAKGSLGSGVPAICPVTGTSACRIFAGH